MLDAVYFKTLPAGPFGTNAYLIGPGDSDMAVLIDAPPQCASMVRRTLDEDSRRLAALLITHPHFDHVMDASSFAAEGIPVHAHRDAEAGLAAPDALGLVPTPSEGFPGAEIDVPLAGGDRITLAGMTIHCLSVPGHSPGSLAFHFPDFGLCFVGDAIFQGSVGRTDLPGGDFDRLAESIQTKIYSLSDDTELCPGHGPRSTVGHEKRSNPFVRGG